MNTINSTDGTPIAYQRSGTGRPLVLVHGAVADHSRWMPILPLLQDAHTLYAIDRRGRGRSGDNQPYAIEREYEDVAAVVDSIAGPVDLLGHSFGAACALEAARLTSNIRRLILYEPPPPGVAEVLPDDVKARLSGLLDAGEREELVTTFLLEVAGLSSREVGLMRASPSWAERVAAAHTIPRELEWLRSSPPFDAARYAGVRVPALLLLGGESPPFYRRNVEAIAGALAGSRIEVMPGQRHIAMNTAPELFASLVLAFLDGPDEAG